MFWGFPLGYSNARSGLIIKFEMARLQNEDASKTQLFTAWKGWKEHLELTDVLRPVQTGNVWRPNTTKHCLVTKHFTVWPPCLVMFDRV